MTVEGSGPYEFMVDTGSEFTIIDPALAAELQLQSKGSIGMTAVTTQIQAQLVLPRPSRPAPIRSIDWWWR